MKVAQLKYGQEIIGDGTHSTDGNSFESYFQKLPDTHEVHSSFPRKSGDVLYSLRLRSEIDAFPVTMVSDAMSSFHTHAQCNILLSSIYATGQRKNETASDISIFWKRNCRELIPKQNCFLKLN